jgi:hypothetical protein
MNIAYFCLQFEKHYSMKSGMEKVLVVNGAEDVQGRALFIISALYHCIDFLKPYLVRFVGVRSGAVEIAAEVLGYDTGLNVEISGDSPGSNPQKVFRNAVLYAAVVFDDVSDLGLKQATAAGVPNLIAMQFPKLSDFTAERISRLASAHDPVIFAQSLRESLM